jgi:hypothetical protein
VHDGGSATSGTELVPIPAREHGGLELGLGLHMSNGPITSDSLLRRAERGESPDFRIQCVRDVPRQPVKSAGADEGALGTAQAIEEVIEELAHALREGDNQDRSLVSACQGSCTLNDHACLSAAGHASEPSWTVKLTGGDVLLQWVQKDHPVSPCTSPPKQLVKKTRIVKRDKVLGVELGR